MSDAEDYDAEVEQTQPETKSSSKSKAPAKPKKGPPPKSKAAAKAKSSSASKTAAKAPAKAAAAAPAAAAAAAAEGEDFKDDNFRHSTGVLVSRPQALDVKIDGFTLAAWGTELIKDTCIELTIGRRYGLIGSNGSGKTQFLRCLARREVPIPDHIDIYLLDEEAAPSELLPIPWVVGEVEKEVKRLEAEADRILEEDGPESDRLNSVYERLEEFEPSTFEVRAARLLVGLGFNKEFLNKKTKDMSGGWRMRVALARALFIRPTLLLLDEPTNHLDLEACVWLEDYLKDYPRCLVAISHSQDFLNTVCSHIIHITHKKTLQTYTGNYDMFVQTKAENEVNQMKRWKKEQEDIKHIKQFIASAGTYANLVRQAKSKQKIIDKMEERGLTEKVVEEAKFNFVFGECEVLSPPVLTFHNVSFAYSGKVQDMLYQNVNCGVDMDSRIALVGPNGAGKSTLLKLMTGELAPTSGDIKRHLHLKMGKYHQHTVQVLDPEQSTLDFMRSQYPEKKMEEQEWRALIGRYGIAGKDQKVKIGTLSDGYKSRIVFAMLAIDRPNMLLLDEPTNHLDMECIDALAEAINEFKGGVILVSHDFRLISQVAKEIWICDDKTITRSKGDIRQYKDSLLQKMKKVDVAALIKG